MKILKAYIAYVKDNPEGYWFKRKAYGWGWTPATKEGWLVTLVFIGSILFIAWRAESSVATPKEELLEVVLPVVIAVAIFIGICLKTGEWPRWQWRLPAKYFKD